MEHYKYFNIIFPVTMYHTGAGDMYIILSAIARYLERSDVTYPDSEYIIVCDMFDVSLPTREDEVLFNTVLINVLSIIANYTVIAATVLSRDNCLILEISCNPLSITYYRSNR